MAKVAILTDSTAGLSETLTTQYNITVIPLTVVWGEQSLRDGIDITPQGFYTRLSSTTLMPSTSMITVAEMKTAFERLMAQGYDVLGIFLSSKFSGTYESALQARNEMGSAHGRVAVIDSQFTTMAMGWPVLTAARAAQAGENLTECLKITEQARQNSGVLFVVETLEFLRRGGRIGGAQALLGTALNLKPLLEMRDGRIESVERVRTKSRAVERMLTLVEERVTGRTPLHVACVHANVESEAQAILETVGARLSPAEAVLAPLSPVIGTHAGPGTVALAYMAGL